MSKPTPMWSVFAKHITIRATPPDYQEVHLECLHCGRLYVATMPCSFDMFAVICGQFNREHQECPVPVAERSDE